MMNDIAALQYMYGANYSHNSTSTIYTWSPTTGEMFVNGVGQGRRHANRYIFRTVWDGGGNDTYDLSNYTPTSMSISRPASGSTVDATQLAKLGDGHYRAPATSPTRCCSRATPPR